VWPWFLSFWTLASWFGGGWFFSLLFSDSADIFGPGFSYFGPNEGDILFSVMTLLMAAAASSIPVLILAYIMRPIAHATWLKMAREDWVPRATRIYNSYYCFRDDTMFDRGYGGRPEQFIGIAFS
jgi:hypothetical protein